jgi:hypothetical protein
MMNERYGKTRRVLSLLIALVMVFSLFGSVTAADTEEPQQERGTSDFYLVGSMNNWNVNEDYKLAQNTSAGTTEYMITLDLTAGAEFKVTNGDKSTWYPSGSNNNYTISEAGKYNVYFRPNYDGEAGWHYNCLYAEKNEITTYAITVTTDGNGTAVADKTAAQAGETVTVTITPNEGYMLDVVTGAPETWNLEGNTGTFTMPAAAVTLSVTFKEIPPAEPYRITTHITGEGTVDIPTSALEGSEVTVTVAPADGNALRALKVDGRDVTASVSENSYTFTMPGYAITVEAVFEEVATGEHMIYMNVYGLGTAFADKTTAAPNETVTITVEESIGYVFCYIEVNGVSQGNGVTTFTMPDTDVTVNVVFERMAYAITLHSGVQGSMNAIPRNNEAFSDTEVQIIVNANEDYAVKTLTVTNDTTNAVVDVTLKSQDGQTFLYEFTMPAAPVTVTATYKKLATNGYYLIGQYGWTAADIDGNDKFVDDLSVSGQMLLTVDLAAGQQFKVVKVVDGAIDTWYPAQGANYTVTDAEAGTSVVYFRPGYGGPSDWFQNCIFVRHLPYDYYLVDIATSQIRQDDKLFINKEFNGNEIINSKNETIKGLYGSEYEHMVLTWLESGDKIKVVKVVNGAITEWLPDGMGLEYPTYRYSDSEYPQDPAYTGMVFVFFEEQIGNVTGYDGQIHCPRVDWTNHVFDVQKAYKADAADKSTVNPLNAESLTYNLEHGSISLSTGTPFIRDSRTNETNIIYELALNQKVYVSILAEAGYALDGTPYITYGSNTVNLTKDGDRWYFTMPAADVVIHAPMRKVFRTQSVLLSGQIGVNFYVDLTGLDTSKCEMHFKIGNSTEEQIDTFDPNCHSSITPTNYGFTCFLNAIQMADDITAELWCNGEKISYKHYSLEEYVKYFERADSTQDGVVDALRVIRAMIDFGYYAQKYMFLAKPALIDQYTEVERHYATQYDFASIKRMTESHSFSNAGNVSIGNSDIKSLSASIAVDSATALIITMKMKPDTTSTPEIKVGTQTLSLENPEIVGSTYTWRLTDTTQGSETRRFEVRIEGISPHNLDKLFTIKGTAGGSFTIKASTFSFIDLVLSLGSASYLDEMKMLVASMYAFHEAEVEYRNYMANH